MASGYHTGQWRYRAFLPSQKILLDNASPDPIYSSISPRSLLEWQNLSPSYGSTESPIWKVWCFFKYIFFLPHVLSPFSSGTPTALILDLLILFHGPPEALFILFLNLFLFLQTVHFYWSVFKFPYLSLCISVLKFPFGSFSHFLFLCWDSPSFHSLGAYFFKT